jgi:hypothetical protein
MNRFIIWAFFCVALASSSVYAGLREYEMPGLAGPSADTARVDTLVYNGPSGSLTKLFINVSGYIDEMGRVLCPDWPPPDTVNWSMSTVVTVKKPGTSGYWQGGPAVLTAEWEPFNYVTELIAWNVGYTELIDGDILEISMLFRESGIVHTCFELTPPTTGVLLRVALQTEISYWIPVENTTWGRIKALYRASN